MRKVMNERAAAAVNAAKAYIRTGIVSDYPKSSQA